MSVICRTFVQNAWRSDLCSNCFKSLEDHSDVGRRSSVCDKLSSMPRYVPQAPSLYQSRGISTSLKWRLNESLYDRVSRRDIASQTPNSKTMMVQQQLQEEQTAYTGNRSILVKAESVGKKFRNRPSVDFSAEEALVIGYGGNDYDSDTSPWEMGSDDDSIDLDLLDDNDEDRKITKLTKNNTEFNSFNKNLLSSDVDPSRIKKTEEKLNSINNNVSNQQKPTDKTINILTYNDFQSRKPEKKLNQYFFPSSTDAIKSYLNGHGNSLVIEETVVKNNNERCQMTNNAKIQNYRREVEKKDSDNTNMAINEDFTPLNTRTYCFVSELNKNNVSFEQSSDSDYSTCRHTTGDSTDSESFHDVEESRILPNSSFLHGKYSNSTPLMNEVDVEKKYDAGSSTSGDVSNFSDDSDTHESAEVVTYESENARISTPLSSTDSKALLKEVCNERSKSQEISPKVENKTNSKIENSYKEKIPPSSSKNNPEIVKSNSNENICKPPTDANLCKSSGDINREIASSKIFQSSKKDKDNETSISTTKSHTTTNINIEAVEINKSTVSKNKMRSQYNESEENASDSKNKVSPQSSTSNLSCNRLETPSSETGNKQDACCRKIPEDNLIGNENSKENILLDKEFREYEDNSDNDKSPEAINNRQSKLAALALELELARRDSESKLGKAPVPPQQPVSPPEVKVRYSLPNALTNCTQSENYPTIKKASAISCASRLASLPDVLQETPAKQKKSRFSLKKLLKRNKESGTFSPANKEVNPKAWKKQTFDRNRLSLEIVHPMDLTSDVPTSADSTPTEEHKPIVSTNPARMMFKGVSSRAKSLSALPQLSSDEQSGCALLECRKMDTVPARKAGTVAERKKNRPSLVRTPSCSALPNRPTSTTNERAPPPKPPPPPPKCKAMHPPPPPPPPMNHHPRPAKPINNSPARPPPPKVPEPKSRNPCNGSSAQELHEQNNSVKEYANLGDIRSLLTPKKPQRPSAFSACPRESEMEQPKRNAEDIYETLPPTAEEEEDHYTYLDEAEAKVPKCVDAKKASTPSSVKINTDCTPCGRPWLDLQTSYAAIAAANYESLAELIQTSMNEGELNFKKVENSLKWKDFKLESKDQFNVLKEKTIYNVTCQNESQDKVTLVVAPRKYTPPQNARNQTRYPVLGSFNDYVPKNFVNTDNYILQESEMASIYILQQSTITTVNDFAKSSSMDNANQYIHLRNYCFVLLQLIHTLKSLQAEGIEEINYDLQILILVMTDEDKPPILVLFPEDKVHLTAYDTSFSRKTLCQATLETMLHFLQIHSIEDIRECIVNGEHLAEPVAYTFKAIAKVLSEEKASSLSQAKGLLEYMLWGPVDVTISQSGTEKMLDTILQRWLDLQRAQMVKSTISHLQNKKSSHLGFHVYEEYQLIFLLQASVKSLKNVISKL